MAAPSGIERPHRSAAIPSRDTLFTRGKVLALNGVELHARGDKARASNFFKRAKEAFELAREVTVFERAVHEAALDRPVRLLRPRKESRERAIRDIGETQLAVGKAYLEINEAGTDFAHPRLTDVVLKLYPVAGDTSAEEKEAHLRRKSPNIQTARIKVTAGLGRIKDVSEGRVPSRLRQLLEHARAIPQYKNYSIDDLILIIQRKKDFEGRVKPATPQKPEREVRVRGDLSEGEEKLLYALLELNPQRNGFAHVTLKEVANHIHKDRLAAVSGEEGEVRNKSIWVTASEMRKKLIDKFLAMWAKRDAQAPKRIAQVIAWLEQEPPYRGLTREGFLAVVSRSVKTIAEAQQIPGIAFVRKDEEIDPHDITEKEEKVVHALFTLNPAGNGFLHISSVGLLSVGIAVFPHTKLSESPSDLAVKERNSFIAKLRATQQLPPGESIPRRLESVLAWIKSQKVFEGLTTEDIILVAGRAISFNEMRRRARGMQSRPSGTVFQATPPASGPDRFVHASQRFLAGNKHQPPSGVNGERPRPTPVEPREVRVAEPVEIIPVGIPEAALLARVLTVYQSTDPDTARRFQLGSFPDAVAERLVDASNADGQRSPYTYKDLPKLIASVAAIVGDNQRFQAAQRSETSEDMRFFLNFFKRERGKMDLYTRFFSWVRDTLEARALQRPAQASAS